MTKRDLVSRVSNQTGVIQNDVLIVVQRLLDLLVEDLARGETVELRNFGVFEVKFSKARVGRNPKLPQTNVQIPPRSVVKFKAGKNLKEQVSKVIERLVVEKKPLVGVQPAPPAYRHKTAGLFCDASVFLYRTLKSLMINARRISTREESHSCLRVPAHDILVQSDDF